MTDVRVVVARSIDALPILQLHRRVLEEGKHFITRREELTETVEEREARIRAVAASDNGVWLVAKHGRDMLGFVTLLGGPLARMKHNARLEVMVTPEVRRKGIGRTLVEAALRWAEENPVITRVGLSVFADNLAAIALYEKMGFLVEGRRIGEYREADGSYRDDVLMYRWVGGKTG